MKFPWRTYLSELVGTALLLGVGLSFVILDFGAGSPVADWLANDGVRRAVTGFMFGVTGALIAVSPVGKISGAHINPVVTLAFHLKGKLCGRDAAGYMAAQFIGAILGSLPLLAWGAMGRSVEWGATTPGVHTPVWVALLGEVVTTVGLIVGLFVFLGHKRLRPFTPLLFPFLYALMVYAEAPLSGTSTNPARSLGPSVVFDIWSGWWIYFIGPLAGTFLGLGIHEFGWFKKLEIGVAKVYHFEHDRYGFFRRQPR